MPEWLASFPFTLLLAVVIVAGILALGDLAERIGGRR
jgi:hypothetical protein